MQKLSESWQSLSLNWSQISTQLYFFISSLKGKSFTTDWGKANQNKSVSRLSNHQATKHSSGRRRTGWNSKNLEKSGYISQKINFCNENENGGQEES